MIQQPVILKNDQIMKKRYLLFYTRTGTLEEKQKMTIDT